MLEVEIAVLKQAEHPNIVFLHEIYETPQAMYLIMEVCTGGSLQDQVIYGLVFFFGIGALAACQAAAIVV